MLLAFKSQTEMWFVSVWSGWEIHLPHWVSLLMARERKGWRRKCVWEYKRGTAGLLVSGLKSLGAPASKQSQLCFAGGQDCKWTWLCPLHFQSQELQREKCLLVSQTARNNSENQQSPPLKQRRLAEITHSVLTLSNTERMSVFNSFFWTLAVKADQ